MRTVPFLIFGLAVAVAVGAAGCGSGGPAVTVHPVNGQVLYAGKPAKGVRVFFMPTSAPGVPDIPANPRGVTDAEGRFKLTTFTPEDGAAEGGYQVLLFWPPEVKDHEEEANTDRLMGWYDAAHSKLTAQLKAGSNSVPPFNLPALSNPPSASEGIPGRN